MECKEVCGFREMTLHTALFSFSYLDVPVIFLNNLKTGEEKHSLHFIKIFELAQIIQARQSTFIKFM